jgi:hypothetical protein
VSPVLPGLQDRALDSAFLDLLPNQLLDQRHHFGAAVLLLGQAKLRKRGRNSLVGIPTRLSVVSVLTGLQDRALGPTAVDPAYRAEKRLLAQMHYAKYRHISRNKPQHLSSNTFRPSK